MRQLQGRLRWYINRLSAMSLMEIMYRCRQSLRKAGLRFFSAEPPRVVGIQTALPALPGFTNGLHALRLDRELLKDLADVAQQVIDGKYQRLGQHWPRIESADVWHRDPITGKDWDRHAFCFAIDFRAGSRPGDPKHVWELNRLQHLQAVAALSTIEQNEKLAKLCIEQLASWIAANQPFRGINWTSGIELALRIFSMAVITSSIEHARFPEHLRRKLVYILALHGIWLERFLSRFSSANNHLVAEAAGLFLLGSLQPDLPRAKKWQLIGRRILEQEALRQIYPDGVGAEQSLTYTAFTLEWLSICSVVAESTCTPFPKPVLDRLRACASFLRCMIDEQGNYPRIGDDDEGSVFYLAGSVERYLPSVLRYAAGALAAPELALASSRQLGEAMFGAVGPGKPPEPRIRVFPVGGYTVARGGGSKTEVLFVLDHGPLGYLSIAAHGHADALSAWLHLGGQPVLVDAGTFGYGVAESWRNHFRSTPAHNTLTLNGESSSVASGSFIWSEKAFARLVRYRKGARAATLQAEHDGYRKRHGANHRRVVSLAAQKILVRDRLIGAAQALPVEINWLVHPTLNVDLREGVFLIGSGNRRLLAIRGIGPLEPKLYQGSKDELRGWYSGHYGDCSEASQCSFRGTLKDREPFTCILDLF